jgi:hypothetical protein
MGRRRDLLHARERLLIWQVDLLHSRASVGRLLSDSWSGALPERQVVFKAGKSKITVASRIPLLLV